MFPVKLINTMCTSNVWLYRPLENGLNVRVVLIHILLYKQCYLHINGLPIRIYDINLFLITEPHWMCLDNLSKVPKRTKLSIILYSYWPGATANMILHSKVEYLFSSLLGAYFSVQCFGQFVL